MSIVNSQDLTTKYKQNVYHIELEVGGWDTVTIQAVAPVAAPIYVYGTLDNGMSLGRTSASVALIPGR